VSSEHLIHRSRPAAGEPDGALVLLHGRGASENDLAPLADELDPERRLVALFPRGPLTLPPGGFHWYVVQRVGYPHAPTFLPTFERLSSWLEGALADAGVPLERTILGGFSQGSVMAHALALASGRPRPAGVVAFSGFVPEVDGFDLDLEARAGLPVFIAHGTHDPIITVDLGRDARDRLTSAGLAVRYVEEPVGHTIGPRALPDARALITAALIPSGRASGTPPPAD
jgi:phospholipase/carboxylesterase